jgi:hypothetical protein
MEFETKKDGNMREAALSVVSGQGAGISGQGAVVVSESTLGRGLRPSPKYSNDGKRLYKDVVSVISAQVMYHHYIYHHYIINAQPEG